MAFIGTPLDTRNTFQSLAGKRFNGDGSTTAFTLDVAPSSTLDIEVFVGNVRQDPNSAYTLSGTTLTFTGAPPSGTNNIYVVHQAKSVGTIDVPSAGVQSGSLASAFLTGQTDIGAGIADADLFLVDDGAGGTLRKTTASRLKTYIGSSPITALNNATENELVTVGSTTTELDAEAKLISDGSGIIIRNASVGTATAGKADMLVIEGNASGDTAGMSILTANDEFGVIHFGDPDDVDIGKIEYYHGSNYMRFYTNGSEGMRLDSSQRLSFGKNAVSTPQLKYDDNDPNFVTNVGSTSYRNHYIFKNTNGTVGSISTTGSNTSFNTSSDYRLKENVSDMTGAIDRVNQLQPKRFNFIADDTNTLVDGFIAHEVFGVVPEAISGDKDGMAKVYYEEGDTIPEDKKVGDFKEYSTTEIQPQAIDQSKLVPLLTSALQEAITKIEALEARVTTLEG